jgi:hypothetical protein
MGACFNEVVWDGALSRAEVREKFEEMIADFYQSDGNDSYNGTFTTCSGLNIRDNKFDSQQAATAWLEENAQKWEEVLAVRFQAIKEELTKQPTFNAGMRWDVFDPRYEFLQLPEAHKDGEDSVPMLRCCLTDALSSRVGSSRNYDIFPADQLTENQQSHLSDVAREYIEAKVMQTKLVVNLTAEIAVILDLEKAISAKGWNEIKEVRASLATNISKRGRLAGKLAKLRERYDGKLWESKQVAGEMHWMLGGVCAM